MNCGNSGCNAQLAPDDDPEPAGWKRLADDKVYCPKCTWMITLIQDVHDGRLTMEQGVNKLLSLDGAP